jgi:acyl dehydratase
MHTGDPRPSPRGDQVGPDAVPAELDALVRVGERFGRTVRWSADEIRRFAELAGDANPMHHDTAFAAATPVGGLIASGTQTVSAMMGAFASWFTRADDGVARDALGMGFSFSLRAPVHAGDELRIEWEVVSRTFKPRHRGWVVTAHGTASTPAGVALQAEGTGLVRQAPEGTTR